MDYNIEFVKVSELKPYKNNVKKHDEMQIDQIVKSIKEFGFRQNLVIDENNIVIVGHGRLAAAEKMGLEEVPCIRASDLTKDQIKALRIADNKLAEKAVWDNDALGEELKAIAKSIDMTDFGFGDFELNVLTNDFEPVPYNDNEIENFVRDDNELLARKRIIISYLLDDEEKIKNLLGLDEIKKVVYNAEELFKE